MYHPPRARDPQLSAVQGIFNDVFEFVSNRIMEDTTENRGRVSASVNNRDRRLIGDAVSAIERAGVDKAVEITGLPRSTIMSFRAGRKPKFIYERTRKALRASLILFSPKTNAVAAAVSSI